MNQKLSNLEDKENQLSDILITSAHEADSQTKGELWLGK